MHPKNKLSITKIWEAGFAAQKEERLWAEIELVLRSDIPYGLMDSYLGHLGTSLVEYAPIGYNDGKLPETATGRRP